MAKKILLILFVITTILLSEDEIDYGWNVSGTPFTIGGYLDMSYDEKREDPVLFDDIALLFFGRFDSFELLGEVEVSNVSLEGKSNRSSDIDLNLERLQLSYAINDTDKIQIGRFNSDIGFWNQTPIAMLQETTSNPHLSQYMYPKATTGMIYFKRLSDTDSMSITMQNNSDIGQEDESIIADMHMAFSYHLDYEFFSWVFNGGLYQEHRLETKSYYAGMAVKYEEDTFMIQAEFFTQQSNEIKDRPYSMYVQTLWRLDEKQDIVIRVESYKDNVLGIKEENCLLGYLYRPWHNVVIKSEYIYHSNASLSRVVSSISVLF